MNIPSTRKKLTAKQMTEIHNHMKRHGVPFERAKEAVVGGYGDAAAEREEMATDDEAISSETKLAASEAEVTRLRAALAAIAARLVDAFAAIGVKPDALKVYLGHDLGSCSPTEIDELRGVYTAVKEGTSWKDMLDAKTGVVAEDKKPTEAGNLREDVAAAQLSEMNDTAARAIEHGASAETETTALRRERDALQAEKESLKEQVDHLWEGLSVIANGACDDPEAEASERLAEDALKKAAQAVAP